MNEKKAIHAIISGRVQGVFFRMETMRTAQRMGVSGWVRNLSDGTVEALFEGEAKQVDQVLRWCESGPPMASVTDIRTDEVPYRGGFKDFSIR